MRTPFLLLALFLALAVSDARVPPAAAAIIEPHCWAKTGASEKVDIFQYYERKDKRLPERGTGKLKEPCGVVGDWRVQDMRKWKEGPAYAVYTYLPVSRPHITLSCYPNFYSLKFELRGLGNKERTSDPDWPDGPVDVLLSVDGAAPLETRLLWSFNELGTGHPNHIRHIFDHLSGGNVLTLTVLGPDGDRKVAYPIRGLAEAVAPAMDFCQLQE